MGVYSVRRFVASWRIVDQRNEIIVVLKHHHHHTHQNSSGSLNHHITLKFDWHLGSTAAEVQNSEQSDDSKH